MTIQQTETKNQQKGEVVASRSRTKRDGRFLSSVSAAALMIFALAGGAAVVSHGPALAGQVPIVGEQAAGQMSVADLVEKVKPAVVAIKVNIKPTVEQSGNAAPPFPKFPENSPMERFFKQFGDQFGQVPGGGQQIIQGQGSGFFISPDGYIVTNNHVVDHATKVQITLDNGRTIDAKVIGTDPKTDLALIKVETGDNYPYVTFDKEMPRVGENVVAIGNPYGLGGTVTAGIVSARGRDIGAGPYDDFLQIDAAVNRGNSGGPTFNMKGEVVGVNTAIMSPTGGSIGIGFAIPSATVQQVVAQLKEHGSVERGYLGVRIQPVTQDIADSLGLSQAKGALVDTVERNTPAAKAGIKAGDVITVVNGAAVEDSRELARLIGAMKPASKVDVTYMRNGKELTASFDLTSMPSSKTASAFGTETSKDAVAGLGLTLAPANDVQGAGDTGVAVVDLDPNGTAAQKGLQSGDIILEVAGKSVETPVDVQHGVDAAKSNGRTAVLMKVKTPTGTQFVALPVPKA
jgi:serine protease Do